MFSCEFCEISKNTFFIEHLRWLLLEKNISYRIFNQFKHVSLYKKVEVHTFAHVSITATGFNQVKIRSSSKEYVTCI